MNIEPAERLPLVIALSLPEYTIDKKPDYATLGSRIDRVIEENFNGKEVAIRALSIADHPNYNLDELVQVILGGGTDKYDPVRKGVAHEEFEPYRPDIQASFGVVGKDLSGEGADIIKKFYENAPLDRGYSLRIDILVIYDLNQLVRAEKMDKDKPGVHPRLEPYLFRFKDPEHKPRALLGIIKILR